MAVSNQLSNRYWSAYFDGRAESQSDGTLRVFSGGATNSGIIIGSNWNVAYNRVIRARISFVAPVGRQVGATLRFQPGGVVSRSAIGTGDLQVILLEGQVPTQYWDGSVTRQVDPTKGQILGVAFYAPSGAGEVATVYECVLALDDTLPSDTYPPLSTILEAEEAARAQAEAEAQAEAAALQEAALREAERVAAEAAAEAARAAAEEAARQAAESGLPVTQAEVAPVAIGGDWKPAALAAAVIGGLYLASMRRR